ncbi:MAG: HAD family hydrolase [Ignavibacteria bacterium]|nr:HAD family hydrolase [Ignavibacteria bacterium]
MHFPNLKAIVFDLDNTLLDHSAAEREAISKFLPAYYDEPSIGTIFKEAPERFLAAYRHWNERLWLDLAMERITADELKWQRFALTLRDLVPEFTEHDAERLGRDMGRTYLELYADGWRLLPDAAETVRALGERFSLGLITNGFSEQQRGKLARFGWESRFDAAILSGELGVMKPHKAIFDHALAELGVSAHEAVYIGDHYETDVVGALGAGWRAIWFNPARTPRTENRADRTIFALSELLQISA